MSELTKKIKDFHISSINELLTKKNLTLKCNPPIMFLCGGVFCKAKKDPINLKDNNTTYDENKCNERDQCKQDCTDKTQSLRCLFYRHLKSQPNRNSIKVILSEDVAKAIVKEFSNKDLYHDLLELELDIAYLIGSILLFIESAGSIAELGSFINLENIYFKLLPIFIKTKIKKSSFIKDGPKKLFDSKVKHIMYESISYDFTTYNEISTCY